MEERRNNYLTKNDVKEVIEEAFILHMTSDHHQFVASMLAKEQRHQDMWDKVKAQIVGWGLIGVCSYLLAVFWQDLIQVIKGH